MLWERRAAIWARLTAVTVLLGSAVWAVVLMNRAADFLPWLRVAVIVLAVLGAIALTLPPRRRATRAGALIALLAVLAAPLAWSVDTALSAQSGTTPTAGPAVADAQGGFGGPGGFAGRPGGFRPPSGATLGGAPQAAPAGAQSGQTRTAAGATGGPGGSDTVTSAFSTALRRNAGTFTWAAAAIGSQTAATYQLAAQVPVMPIGGFTGSDPSPTLAQFKQDVALGRIHYFISGSGGRGGAGGSGSASQITSWVASNFSTTSIGGVTVYDLTAPKTK